MEPGNELVLVCINTKAGTSLSEKTWRDRGRVAMLFWTRRQDSEEGSERSLRYWSELGMQHKRIGFMKNKETKRQKIRTRETGPGLGMQHKRIGL